MSKPMSKQMQKLADRYEKATGKKFNAKTNAQKIRAMNDEELAQFLYNYKFTDMCEEGCDLCHYHGDCENRLADWLKQPVEEDNYD